MPMWSMAPDIWCGMWDAAIVITAADIDTVTRLAGKPTDRMTDGWRLDQPLLRPTELVISALST